MCFILNFRIWGVLGPTVHIIASRGWWYITNFVLCLSLSQNNTNIYCLCSPAKSMGVSRHCTLIHFIFIYLGGCTPKLASKWSLTQIGHSSLLKMHYIPTYIHPFLYLSHWLHMHMLQSLRGQTLQLQDMICVIGSNKQIKNAIEFELQGKPLKIISDFCIPFNDAKIFHSWFGSMIDPYVANEQFIFVMG